MYKAHIYIEYINRYTIICSVKISLEGAIVKKCLKRFLHGGKWVIIFKKVQKLSKINILQL